MGSFDGQTSIEVLDLSSNDIATIPHNLLDPLVNLKDLYVFHRSVYDIIKTYILKTKDLNSLLQIGKTLQA